MKGFESFEEGPKREQLIESLDGKKVTKARLQRLLESLNVNYSINGEGGDFEILIEKPEGYAEEKTEALAGKVLNDSYHIPFDRENLQPLIRAINRSDNLRCELRNEENQWVVEVSRK